MACHAGSVAVVACPSLHGDPSSALRLREIPGAITSALAAHRLLVPTFPAAYVGTLPPGTLPMAFPSKEAYERVLVRSVRLSCGSGCAGLDRCSALQCCSALLLYVAWWPACCAALRCVWQGQRSNRQ